MSSAEKPHSATSDAAVPPAFQTTQWTALLDADAKDTAVRNQALSDLYLKYRPPLLRYVERKWPVLRDDAGDLFHDFLIKAIDGKHFGRADRSRGKFRTFLLTLFGRFLKDEWQRRQAAVRKPDFDHESLLIDKLEAGRHFKPDYELLDYEWGIHVIDLVQEQLKDYYERKRKPEFYSVLRRYLTVKAKDRDLEQAAEALKISVSAVRSEVHRLRKRHRAYLEDTVGETLGPSESIQDEIQYLLGVVCAIHRRSDQGDEPAPGF